MAMASPNSASRTAATGRSSSVLAHAYAPPHHAGVPLRNGSAGDGPRSRGGRSSERNANGSPASPHTEAATAPSWWCRWLAACPLAAWAGEMESESKGAEREAGLGLVEAMDDEAGGRSPETAAAASNGRPGVMAFIKAKAIGSNK
uniref:Uncharacterized protein n=1 Tax=Zea mays TaxID=4577 RepID=B6TN84_MAIZE|nr:hypothetical protein [Zea mays]